MKIKSKHVDMHIGISFSINPIYNWTNYTKTVTQIQIDVHRGLEMLNSMESLYP